jgi:hypothetical protein
LERAHVESLGQEMLAVHDAVKEARDKFVAHPVNALEDVQVSARIDVDTSPPYVKDVAYLLVQGLSGGVDEVRAMQELVRKLLVRVDNLAGEAYQACLAEAKSRDVQALLRQPPTNTVIDKRPRPAPGPL